jgi:uncharacterized protein
MEWIFPILTVFSGYLVLGITGFGSALIVVPLLAWKWPLPEVVALALLMDAPASALFGGLNFRQVQFSELRRLLPGMAVGSVAGLWLVGALQPQWPLLALGLYVIGVGINALRGPGKAPPKPLPAPAVHAAGVAIGVVEMMFGTAGPLVMAWLQRRLPGVHSLRATLPVVMLVAVCTVLLTMGAAGQLSQGALWQRWLVLVGVALAGVATGHRLARYVPAAALRRAIFGLLILSGLMLMGRALR